MTTQPSRSYVMLAIAIIVAGVMIGASVFASSSVGSLGYAAAANPATPLQSSTTTGLTDSASEQATATSSVGYSITSTGITVAPAPASGIIELNATDGSTVCPYYLSGYGAASWNPDTDTCTLTGTAPVSPTLMIKGSTLVIDRGVTLAVDENRSATVGTSLAIYSTLDNYGTINATSGVPNITNYGVINNYGIIESQFFDNLPFAGQGIVNNFASGTIINAYIMNNFGLVVNNGTLDNRGSISECTQTNLALYCGTIKNFGTMECSASCSIQTTTTERQATDNTTSLSS
jgi:hypothetical protein